MREIRTYGSVRGARGDARPYRDQSPSQRNGMGIASGLRRGRNDRGCDGLISGVRVVILPPSERGTDADDALSSDIRS